MRADVITGVSAFVMPVVGADISANAESVVVTIAVLGFEFDVRETYTVDIFSGVVSSVRTELEAVCMFVVKTPLEE